jgi:hypothetical protein
MSQTSSRDSALRVLTQTVDAVKEQKPIKATDLIVLHFDDLFLDGDFDTAGFLLRSIDPTLLPPRVLRGVLLVSKPARQELNGEYEAFFGRVKTALHETWKQDTEEINSVEQRYG